MNQRTHLLPAALATLAAATLRAAGAFVDLSQGRALTAVNRTNPKSDRISFNWVRDPVLQTIPSSPLCPTQTKIRVVTDTEVLPEVALDCSKWAIAGTGFVYKDSSSATGLRHVLRLRPGTLSVLLKGPGYTEDPIDGPVAFVETRVQVGATEYCGRWAAPPGKLRKNDAQTDEVRRADGSVPDRVRQRHRRERRAVRRRQRDRRRRLRRQLHDHRVRQRHRDALVRPATTATTSAATAAAPTAPPRSCGDGVLDPGEACDDGNVAAGDCCSPTCAFETAGTVLPRRRQRVHRRLSATVQAHASTRPTAPPATTATAARSTTPAPAASAAARCGSPG